MRNHRTKSRSGAVLVLVLVAIVTLFTFVALAIDLGMLAVARTQLQDAADVGAMTGARSLNGDTAANNNYAAAAPNAVTAATANTVLSKPISSGQVSVQIGRYVYVPAAQRFEGVIPGPANENWSMAVAQVSSNLSTSLAFAKVFNVGTTTMQATATAVHRPRDVAVVLDFSGSMRYGSTMGLPFSSSARTSSNNPDAQFPQFGHYAAVSSAALQASSFTLPYGEGNISTTTSDSRGPVVEDFYSNSGGSPAFAAAPASYGTTPIGDNYLKINNNTGVTYATSVQQLLNTSATTTKNTTFESASTSTAGYMGIVGQFNGYTTGPGYWGKSFFVWPPDPVATRDWRRVYFTANNSGENTRHWDASGNWKAPSAANYAINYTAILNFIKNVGPNPFPTRLQSGRVLYYDAIPSSISSTYPPSNLNERFWKDYIDYVLGVIQYNSSTYEAITQYTGYGADYTWGTVRISAKPTGANASYMDYRDNPKRPKTHFWFGPMTMIDFLGNYNMWYHNRVSPSLSRYCWWPGTCHESPMYACKLGIRAALDDIRTNHPNNLVALMMFSHPAASAGGDGRFNRPRVGLGRNYTRMQEALWYPPSTLGNAGATIRPYDSENTEVPRAMGATCYAMGLMQAYNQFSAHSSLSAFNPSEPNGDAGGNGRRGAQKIVIFETDGLPNHTATASLVNNGAHQSYYRVRYKSGGAGGSEFPTVTSYSDNNSTVTSQINSLCSQLAALETAGTPGYSTASKKVLIHCIGFGSAFSPGSATRASGLATLQQMQMLGNVNDGMPEYKLIYGNEDEMVAKMQQAFTQILQDGVQVALAH